MPLSLSSVVASAVLCAASQPAAAPPAASVGPTGGRVPSLIFAVVGDTRPPLPDVITQYPSEVASDIFRDIQALSPRPQFVVATGDYMFASPKKPAERSEAQAQAELYLKAAHRFTGQLFPAMGNHECRNHASSNCCPTCSGGTPAPYQAFLWMLGQVSLPNQVPYYTIHVGSSDAARPWTAKFVFIAANAWDEAQAAWLTAALAEPTTYTFVVRHEPDYENDACLGCGGSDAIVKKNPYTLLLVGHDHTFKIVRASRELVIGLGGAPMYGDNDHHGFAICTQQSDGNIACQERDVGTSTSSYQDSKVVVTPDGHVIR
jgi:hypothetical protein